MKKKSSAIYCIILLLILLSCREVDLLTTRGYYTDDYYYEVIAYGKAPADEKNPVKARNIAAEAALIEAQKKVKEEFNLYAEDVIKSGIIKKKSFSKNTPGSGDGQSCRIIYVVNVKKLKKEP